MFEWVTLAAVLTLPFDRLLLRCRCCYYCFQRTCLQLSTTESQAAQTKLQEAQVKAESAKQAGEIEEEEEEEKHL